MRNLETLGLGGLLKGARALERIFDPRHELLKPILDPRRRIADSLLEVERDMWVTDVVMLLLNEAADTRGAFLRDAAHMQPDQQANLVFELFDNGWRHSGRRVAIPVLVEQLISEQVEDQIDRVQTMLELVRKGLRDPVREQDPVAKDILSVLPERIVPIEQDLRFFGLNI